MRPVSTLPTTPEQSFQTARAAAQQAAAFAKTKANRLGLVRLFSFFGLVALVILLSIEIHPFAGVATIVVGLIAFNKLVGFQQELDAETLRKERVVELNDGELLSLDYDFSGFDGGADFKQGAHPYSGDLDVFGTNSIFQQHNRTGSLVGRSALASYMRFPLQDVAQIEARQEAVKELAANLDWRQRFLADGTDKLASAAALDKLRAWAKTPMLLVEGYWPIVIIGLSIFNLLWLVSFAYFPFYFCLLGYAPTFYLIYRAKLRVDEIHEQTEEAVELLARYRFMIASVEQQQWQSPLLSELSLKLTSASGEKASVALKDLAYASRQLAVRSNPFVLLLNLFSFWEIRYARQLEAWKQKHLGSGGQQVFPAAAWFDLPTITAELSEGEKPGNVILDSSLEGWLLSLGAFDALTSLAAAHFRWPSWTFPSFSKGSQIGGSEVLGVAMNHPLLKPAKCVSNDFRTPARAHIKLLTGSNMAGKSTFLRTVGLNIAMAHWGGVVPAQSLSLPLLLVYTSMRTQDDLHEGASAFYAELQRLRTVVQATKRGDNIFFLLDEILKGTNSQDRHEGGRALIKQLIRNGGSGIVATHDLELGAMASESKAVDNIRLEVETDEVGHLFFDYTVKPGLAESRNATILMEQMGLGVDD